MKETQKRQTDRRGLTDAAVAQARRAYGANVLSRKKRRGFLRHFVSNLNDPIIRILLGALIVNLLLIFRGGEWVETVGIGVAVLLATLISTASEYGSAKAFDRLSDQSADARCRVRRNGVVTELPISDIVVGDIVLLGAGEQIPADGRLISGEMRTDQSALTGESREIRKLPSQSLATTPDAPSSLFRGCSVTDGGGEMEVLAVGDATALGEISREIQEEQRESPLRLRLARLARQISVLGYVAAALVALAYLFNVFFLDSGMQGAVIALKLKNTEYILTQLFHAFTLALTVIVVAVPEGLPMMIAVVLSANTKRMVKDSVLVRKPVGIEAAGSMNVLFTDKTGTLTEGRMRVSSVLMSDGRELVPRELMRRGGECAELISLCFRFCNGATVGQNERGERVALGGNATARALLESVLPYPAPRGINVTSALAFDSERKYAAVGLEGRRRVTLLMGAPERLFPYVADQMGEDGRIEGFRRALAERCIRERTERGSRVIAVALSRERIPATAHGSAVRGSLTYLGAACLSDPIRPEAAHSVARLSGAGIQVVMVTGDSAQTATSIARECGILSPRRDIVLTGDALSRLSDARIKEMLPRLAVVARAVPTDKSRLVRLSQELGMVTGMTGDGINDAPALRRADVGFAMGNGTQVAKDAGDVIILDSNLASIARAVLYGRSIFKSIRRFITLQLTMNFCAVGVTMICPFLGVDSPVTVVQMLWINVIMDTLGGLAFAGEPALEEYMREPPKKRDEPILNRYMINQILLLGGFTVGLCLFFLLSPTVTSLFRTGQGRIYLMTAFFALFIFSSVFNCFNARTDGMRLFGGLRKNPIFIVIMSLILVIQIVFVYLGGEVLRTVPLTARELLVTMSLSLSVFPAEMIRRALWRLRGKKGGF